MTQNLNKIITIALLPLVMVSQMYAQKVSFVEESTITKEGLHFWYPNGKKAFHYASSISPRGDCFTVVNGYIFFGWYRGGMKNRDLMISRKKIGSGKWVNVKLPHKNTLIGANKDWGDTHRTISVGVSKIDGTVHIFYDHHNEALNYIVSKKDIAFGPDKDFKTSNFEKTRENLAPGEKVRITYPKITQNEEGEVILNYRKGAAVGGGEIVHVYDGKQWSKAKQISDGRPDLNGNPNGTLAKNPNRVGWNYAYGVPYYNNNEVYYAFSVRWAEKKSQNILNEGVYLAKTGPKFSDEWEDLKGKKHKLPIVDYSPFLVANPPSNGGKGASGGTNIVVSEKGDVHITYNGRGKGTKYQYTFSRKAGDKEFTRHDGVMRTGLASNGRFYTVGANNEGVITVSSGEPGNMNYRKDFTYKSGKKFKARSVYLNDGNLVMIASENKASDKVDLYAYVFKIENDKKENNDKVNTENVNNENSNTTDSNNVAPEVNITAPLDGQAFNVGEEIILSATAKDTDGNLDKVNFKINNKYHATDKNRPFSNSFTPTEPGTYVIGARAFDKEGLAIEKTVTIEVTSSLSNIDFLKDKTFDKIKVYPSPTETIINISGLENVTNTAYIINLTGKIIKSTSVNNSQSKIDVAELPSGVYFLKLESNTSQKTISFIKN